MPGCPRLGLGPAGGDVCAHHHMYGPAVRAGPPAVCLVLQELNEQKNELLTRVQTLKRELQDWRGKLDAQVKTYRVVRAVRWRALRVPQPQRGSDRRQSPKCLCVYT